MACFSTLRSAHHQQEHTFFTDDEQKREYCVYSIFPYTHYWCTVYSSRRHTGVATAVCREYRYTAVQYSTCVINNIFLYYTQQYTLLATAPYRAAAAAAAHTAVYTGVEYR